MQYYAKLSFIQSPKCENSYILTERDGEVKNLSLARYTDCPQNIQAKLAGLEYIHFGVPRNPSMRRYFAHTFEGLRGKPISSVEALDSENRTFGDTLQLGYKDLILVKFSEDMKLLNMWFLKDKGNYRQEKRKYFDLWTNGESLEKFM